MADTEAPKEEVVAAEGQGEEMMVPMEGNSVGFFDGYRFYLRTFPVWYRTKFENNEPATSGAPLTWHEYGTEKDGATYQQTMSRMTIYYKLNGADSEFTESSLTVQMSSWELKVIIGEAEGKKSAQRTVAAVSGDLNRDIRPSLSSWAINEYEDGKYLEIFLAKKLHLGWAGIFSTNQFNIHKKSTFGWSGAQPNVNDIKVTTGECDKLQTIPSGERQEVANEMVLGIPPEELCTGVEFLEDQKYVIVQVHMDGQALCQAEGRAPLEEFFIADVEAESIEIKMKGDELPVCWATFSKLVLPQQSTWEIKQVRRNLPEGHFEDNHAFHNMALRIILTKAQPGMWGDITTDLQTAEFEQIREVPSHSDVAKASLTLSPANPNCVQTKTERAKKLCTGVTTTEDVILNKAYVSFHLWDKLEEYIYRFFKADIDKFFAVKVKETMLTLCVMADADYVVCEGAFAGPCDPARTSWNISKEKNDEGEGEHIVIKVTITKGPEARGTKWGSAVFTQLEPWQMSAIMCGEELPKALVEETAALTEGRDGE